MRRFACQRLYLSPDTYFIRYVVELGNNGKIQRYYPLEEEIYATQWIGGSDCAFCEKKTRTDYAGKEFQNLPCSSYPDKYQNSGMLCMAYCQF